MYLAEHLGCIAAVGIAETYAARAAAAAKRLSVTMDALKVQPPYDTNDLEAILKTSDASAAPLADLTRAVEDLSRFLSVFDEARAAAESLAERMFREDCA